jgi:hypothetical protein
MENRICPVCNKQISGKNISASSFEDRFRRHLARHKLYFKKLINNAPKENETNTN